MTLSELKSQVRALLSYELESERFSDSTLLTYIHHALRDFALRAWWRLSESSRSSPVPAGTVEVDFSDASLFTPPLLKVSAVLWEGRELEPLRLSELWYYIGTTGTPSRVLIEASKVRLYPVPSASGVIIGRGIRYPSLPQSDTDVIDFPAGYEMYLAHGVVWQVAFLEGIQNTPNVQRSLQLWERAIGTYREQNWGRH
jgi:hypothetical protein